MIQDLEVTKIIQDEQIRQQQEIQLIASENFASAAVLQAQSSVFSNKYAEGYPGKRYYNGCINADRVENLAIDRLKKLFNCEFANVQPHSGSQANAAVFLALLNPGDTILGMSMQAGGHLTHGSKVSMSGKWFNAVSYNLNPHTEELDYQQIEELAMTHRPKLIIAGYSAFPRALNWQKFREIANKVGALLLADIAHIAGIIAAGLMENPLKYADIVTSTTHKTLRGPRGGIIMSNNPDLYKKINFALFPGTQGGPLMHIIAAKAICFWEALQPEFNLYIQQVLQNTQNMSKVFQEHHINLVTNGSDNHMLLIKLINQKMNGHELSLFLQEIGIICNKNGIPNDPLPPMQTSGIRIGSPACTTLGLQEKDFQQIAQIISEAINNYHIKEEIIGYLKQKVQKITQKFQKIY